MVNPVRNTTQTRANTIVSDGVKKIFLAVLFLVTMHFFLFAAQPLRNATDESAINFSLQDLESKQVSLSDSQNKPIILFFWTTWCPFCQEELKTLSGMYEKMAKDGLELFVINVGEPFYKVDNFAKTHHFSFHILLDKDSSVADLYNILGVPTYIFVDKNGHIVSREHYFSQELYNELIAK